MYQKGDPRHEKIILVSEFKRPAADMKMDDPKDVRPPQVLREVVKYIRECICDLDRLPAG